MRARLILPALLVLALMAVASCSGGRSGPSRTAGSPRVGEGEPAANRAADAPPPGGGAPAAGQPPATLQFTGRTLDGQPFNAASLAGRPTLVWFWAPWCGTCAGQASTVTDVAKEFAGRINVVGVAGMGDEAAMRDFVKDTAVAGFPQVSDQAGEVWRRFGVTQQSTFVLIDADGKVLHKGWLDHEQLTGRIAQLAA